MWKADFGAVDGAIASRLEHREDVMVPRVENDSFGSSLCCEPFQISYHVQRKDPPSSYLEALEGAGVWHRASVNLVRERRRGGR